MTTLTKLIKQGDKLFQNKKYAEAREVFKQIVDKDPLNQNAWLNWGHSHFIEGNYEQALQVMEEANKVLPNNPAILIPIADCLINLGRPEGALLTLENYLRENPPADSSLLKKIADYFSSIAIQFSEQQKPELAKNALALAELAFENIVKIEPNDADVYANWGNTLANQAKDDQAFEAYKTALDNNPSFELAKSIFEVIGYSFKRYQDVLNILQANPDLLPPLEKELLMADMASLLERYDQAIAACKRALEFDPDSAEAYAIWGNALNGQDKKEQAFEAYKTALTKNPIPGLAKGIFQMIGYSFKRYQDVLNILQESPDLVPPLEKELLTADMENLLDHYDQAIDGYERALKLDPDNTNLYAVWGDALNGQDRKEQAFEAYKTALTKNPTPELAKGIFQMIGYSFKRYQDVLNILQDSPDLLPPLEKELLTAHLERSLIHYDKAIAACKRALEFDPDSAEAYASWGDALYNQDKKDQAFDTYRIALTKNPTPELTKSIFEVIGYSFKRYQDVLNILQDSSDLLPPLEKEILTANMNRSLAHYDQAIAACERALQIDPANAEAYAIWGDVLYDQDKIEEAFNVYKVALTKNPSPKLAKSLFQIVGYSFKRYQTVLDILQNSPDLLPPLEKELLTADIENLLDHYDQAIDGYERALKLDPNNQQIHAELAYNYFCNDQLDKAEEKIQQIENQIEALEKQIKTDSESAGSESISAGETDSPNQLREVKNTLGVLEYKIGLLLLNREEDTTDVWSHWQKTIANSPASEETKKIGDEFLDKKRELDKAVIAYTAYIDNNKTNDDQDYITARLGLSYYFQYEYSKAKNHLQNAVNYHGGLEYFAHYWLGIVQNDLREFTLAEYHYREAFRLHPDVDYVVDGLVSFLTSRKKKIEALAVCQKALVKYVRAADQNIVDTKQKREGFMQYLIGNVYLNFGELEEAIRRYRDSHNEDNQDLYAQYNLAHVLEKQGKYKDSRRKWAQVIQAYPVKIKELKAAEYPYPYQAGDLHAFLGGILFAVNNDFEDAEGELKKAQLIDPTNAGYLLSFCQLYQKKKEYSSDRSTKNALETESNLSNYAKQGLSILEQKPSEIWNDIDFRLQGEFQLFLARYDEAKTSFTQALTYNTDLVEAYIGLGTACQRLKEWTKALTAFERARQIDTHDLNTRCSIGEMLIELEQFTDAEQELVTVSRITDHKHIDALILLGKLYTRMGDKAEKSDESQRFTDAIRNSEEALKAKQSSNYSRAITPDERNTILYLCGYCQVQITQAREKKEGFIERLKFVFNTHDEVSNALSFFEAIPDDARNHFETNRAKQQLKNYRSGITYHREMGGSWLQGMLVVSGAIFVFLLAQYLFFFRDTGLFGSRESPKAIYYLKQSRIQPALSLDSTKNIHLIQFTKQTFADADALISRWNQDMGIDVPFDRGWIEMVSAKPDKILSEGFYVLITFSSLLFLIAGLVLPELTKLKVGNIELEKAKLETITSTTTLNISSGTNSPTR